MHIFSSLKSLVTLGKYCRKGFPLKIQWVSAHSAPSMTKFQTSWISHNQKTRTSYKEKTTRQECCWWLTLWRCLGRTVSRQEIYLWTFLFNRSRSTSCLHSFLLWCILKNYSCMCVYACMHTHIYTHRESFKLKIYIKIPWISPSRKQVYSFN